MKDWVVPIAIALIGGALSGGLVPLIQAMRGRGKDRVDAVAALGETARKWVADFEEEAKEARLEVKEARQELRACRAEAHALADELRNLRLAILHPAATLDGLRDLVRASHGGGDNGTGSVNLYRP